MAKKSKKQLQAELDRHGRDYELAKARGDKQGMEQAHAKANAVRKQAGWTYDQKTGRTYEKVSPIQKQGRLITSERNIALAKAGANPVRAVKQQPVSTRVPTGAKGKTFGKSYAEEKRNQQEVKRVSEKVNQAWENAKRRQTTARVNQIFSEAAKAQGKPVRQLPQSPAITARKVAETLPGVKQVGEDVRTLRTQREQTLKNLPRGEQALRAAAHGLVGSIGSFVETNAVIGRDTISQFKDFGKDYFTTPFSQLQQNYEEKYAGNKIDPYGFGSRHMRESEYFHDRATRDMGKVGKFLTDTGISIAQNAPTMAASAFNPVAGAALMGASAAGAKSYELQQQGVPASEALSRGLLSGAIEAATEKFSIDHFLKTFNGRGLRDAVKNIARQAGVEASEESASYMLNYLADKAAKDPYATFSVGELLENAAGGAISGGVFGGVGSVASSVRPPVSRMPVSDVSTSPRFDLSAAESSFQIPGDTFSERNYQNSMQRNASIPDFDAQWRRYNEAGKTGIPFESVSQYPTATPVDYETAFSAHAAGLNDYKARAMETADRLIDLETMDNASMDIALSEPEARETLADAVGVSLPWNYAEARTVVRNWQSEQLGLPYTVTKTKQLSTTDDFGVPEKTFSTMSAEKVSRIKDLAEKTGESPLEITDNLKQIFEDRYKDALENAAAYIESYQPQGVSIVGTDEYGRGGYRVSNNEKWYSDFYKQNGRAPRKADVPTLAQKLVERDRTGSMFGFSEADRQALQSYREISSEVLNEPNFDHVRRNEAGDYEAVYTEEVKPEVPQPETPMRSGVIDSAASKTVDPSLLETVDQIAKRTGVTVEFTDDMRAAGSYQDGIIRIHTQSGDPVRQVFVHELTHHLEQSGAYTALANTIVRNLERDHVDTGMLKQQIIKEYAENGITLSDDGASREMIAKYAESYLFTDDASIQRLAQENRSLIQKIRDWLHDLCIKLRGTAEEKTILKTEQMYTRVLDSVNGQKKNASSETQYKFSDHKIPTYEELTAKPDIQVVDIRGRGVGRIAEQRKQFMNSPEAQKLYEAPVINRDTGEPVFVTSRAVEHTFSNKGFDQINVAKHIGEIIENAVLTHMEEATHGSDNVTGVYTLFGAVQTEQGVQPVKLKVKEYIDDGRSLPQFIKQYFERNGKQNPYASVYDGRVLELESIEKEEVSSSVLTGTEINSVQGRYPSTSSTIRVADLYDLVNNEYQKYLPKREQESTAYSQGSSFDKLLRDSGYKEQADSLQRAVKKYAAIPRGELAARDVVLPAQRNDDTRVSRFARTAAESSVLTDAQAGEIGKAVAEGRFDYEPISDKTARAHAQAMLDRGESAAQDVWNRVVNSTHLASKNDIAVGEYLLKQAAEAGDTQRVIDLAAQIAAEGTRAGQIVQAMRLLKKMDGAGQAVALDATLKKLQSDLDRNKKNNVLLKVPSELRERLVKAKGEEQVSEVMDEIYQSLADQLPVRWSDKWNAWRYLSMLGNPRTHIRNILGNAAFAPVVGTKNVVGTVIESSVRGMQRIAGKEGITRTKTFSGNIPFTGGKARDFAIQDFSEVRDTITGGGKMNPTDVIREKQKVFQFKPLESLRQMNFNLLEAEDGVFLKAHYVRAMVQFMKSNKVDMDSFSPDTNRKDTALLNRAREYAIREAQKATYRDFSQAAQAISQLSRNSGNWGNVLIEGVLPFKKTPINVLKRGVEYSPAGLLDTITRGTKKLASGEIDANEFIDRLSAGLTGTGISVLGMLLARLGVLEGGLGNDDDERFRDSLGAQSYAVKVGNRSYTIDWLAPASMPLFVGAEMQKLFSETEQIEGSILYDSILNIAEPMTKMSMLDGINSAISAVRYGENPLSDLLANTVVSYVGQAVPTLLGQAARTIDDTARSTYVSKDSPLPSAFQRALQKNRNKIPVLSRGSVAYRDVFGRVQTEPSMINRALQNFVSPGFFSEEKIGPMESELIRLYQETGSASSIPRSPVKNFLVDGERKDLNAQEYETFSYTRGAVMYSGLSEITSSPAYKKMEDADKLKCVSNMIEISNAMAKTEVSDYVLKGWQADAFEAQENGISLADFVMIHTMVSGVKSLKYQTGKNAGKSVPNSKSILLMEQINDYPGLTQKQRQYLYESAGVSKETRKYNRARVSQMADRLRENHKEVNEPKRGNRIV